MLVKIQKIQRGFSLIELMIVISIIGILATIAIPAYSLYTSKAQASEAYHLLDGFKTPVSQQIGENGLTTGCTSSALSSLISAGRYVASINLISTDPNCAVVATFKPNISGSISDLIASKTVTLTFNSQTSAWTCTSSLPPMIALGSC